MFPKDSVLHTGMVYYSPEGDEHPITKDIVIAKRGVFINQGSNSSPIWRLLFSPGGEITAGHSDRFGDLISGGLGTGNDNPYVDVIAVACTYEELTEESQTGTGFRYYNTIFEIYQEYCLPTSQFCSATPFLPMKSQRTEYVNQPRFVNDIIVSAGIDAQNSIIAGLSKCPSGNTFNCEDGNDDFRFIIAGNAEDLKGISAYETFANSSLLPPSDVDVQKLAFCTNYRSTTSSTSPPETNFFTDNHRIIYAITYNGTNQDLYEININEVASYIDRKLDTPILGNLKDISVLTENFPYVTPGPTNYLERALAVSTENGIFVTEIENNNSTILNSQFTNVTAPHNFDFIDYLDFADRPMWSVNKNELFCIIEKTNGDKGIIYSNNVFESPSTGMTTEFADWIEITENNYESGDINKKLSCLWYANDLGRKFYLASVGGQTFNTLMGDYFFFDGNDKCLFVGTEFLVGDEIVYKTDDIFRLNSNELGSGAVNFNGNYWLELGSNDVLVDASSISQLNLNSSNLYLFSGDLIDYQSEIQVDGGTISATSSSLNSTRQKAPPRSDDPDLRTDNDWGGIVILGDNSTVNFIDIGKIQNCSYGISKTDDYLYTNLNAEISNTTFKNHQNSAIYLNGFENSGIDISNSNFSDIQVSAIDLQYLGTGVNVNIIENTINGLLSSSNLVYGIKLQRNLSTLNIDSNIIYETSYGIHFSDKADAIVSNNFLEAGNTNAYHGISITDADIAFTNAEIQIYHNQVYGYQTAINVNRSQNLDITVGIDNQPTQGNRISSNDYALYFNSNQSSLSPKIRDNTALDQQKRFIYSSSSNYCDIDAGIVEEGNLDPGNNSFDPLDEHPEFPTVWDSDTPRVENRSEVGSIVYADGNFWGIPSSVMNDPSFISWGYQSYFIDDPGTITFKAPLFAKPEFLPKPVSQGKIIPEEFSLKQNYPNPFNPSTTIEYWIPEGTSQNVQIQIFNVLGQEVKTLVSSYKEPGIYKIQWNGNDSFNRPVSTGVYFYRMTTNDFVDVKKLLILK